MRKRRGEERCGARDSSWAESGLALSPQVFFIFSFRFLGVDLFGYSQGSMICVNQGCKNMPILGIVKKKKSV